MGFGNETEGGTVSRKEDVLQVTGNLGIYLSGYDGLAHTVDPVTIGDVRRWLEECEKFGLPDDTVLEDCTLSIYVNGSEVVPIDTGEPEWKKHFDALVVLPKEVK